MKESAVIFDQLVNERRSVRIYDADAEFDEGAVKRSIDRAILAPNSSNMQLWEFYRIKSPEALKKVAWMCMNQKAAKTARELVVIVTRRDLWRQRQRALLKEIEGVYEGKDDKGAKRAIGYYKNLIPKYYYSDPLDIWGIIKKLIYFFVGLSRPMVRHGNRADIRISVHKSAALAAQNFMMSMKAEGYDTCPMEGMDSKRIKKLLGLPRKAEINMVIGCGPGSEKGIYSKRFRVPNEEVIFEV
ncbi:nitroreductase family protein [Roseivirga sp. E12]|uniref:nitroreductase family protein n=1 Tax=Roseivirga sp. E12 TaxID=2819237 RepID=UPI001ABD00E6|nr:nitroreductase family protein [Roseivirga sp. E12]MBO3699197.1 nitroreductase family protein [Roseivirga sp. E12]